MPLINLHAHTNLSDGTEDVLSMAKKAHELGHCAFVLTDHDYIDYSFLHGEQVIHVLRKHGLSPSPIIHGSEIKTPWGECLLFGEEALQAYYGIKRDEYLFNYRERDTPMLDFLPSACFNEAKMLFGRILTSDNWLQEFQDRIKCSKHALVLCHPYQFDLFNEDTEVASAVIENKNPGFFEFLKMLHGIEIQNQSNIYKGIDWLYNYMRPSIKKVRNSDAHSLNCLEVVANEIDEPILDESQLIRWLGGNID